MLRSANMSSQAADLLALVSAAEMPLHRCYKALKSSIGERLQQYTSAHSALIEVATALLDGTPPPPAAHLDIKQRAQLVSLLLACAAESQTAPTASDHAAAAALGAAQPRMLRQLHKTYNVGDAASVARAAEALAAEREWAEVAQIIREFGLYERIDPLPILRELVVAENYACALKLVARRPALQLALIRELVAREQHKLAARYVGRFKMGAIVPPPLLRELAFALHRRRVAWLVNSRNHDLIDEFFAQAAAALRAPPPPADDEPPPPAVAEDAEAEVAEASADDERAVVWAVALEHAQWRSLLAQMGESHERRLVVQGCVRHAIAPEDARHCLGDAAPTDAERAAALALGIEAVVHGVATAAEAAATAEDPAYVALGMSLQDAVCVVDDATRLGALVRHFIDGDGADVPSVMGVDAEWTAGPAHGGSACKVQWLQLGTTRRAFLLDLPKLCAELPAELGAALQKLLTRPTLTKVGFGLKADLRKVAASHPALASCTDARPCAELAATATARGAKSAISGALSLSKLAQLTLGKPLDKRMQLSNWARRPLAQSQMRYAALDAIVGARIHMALLDSKRRVR